MRHHEKHDEKRPRPAATGAVAERRRKLDQRLDEALEESFLGQIRSQSASRRRMIGGVGENSIIISMQSFCRPGDCRSPGGYLRNHLF
jgi:hypothetical protein